MKVSNAIVRAKIFSGVCVAWLFVSMAGGVAWGTFDAGCMAFGAIVTAAVAALVPLQR